MSTAIGKKTLDQAIQVARRALAEGFASSEDEKLRSIRLLEQTGTQEAVDLLIQAMEMVKPPIAGRDGEDLHGDLPKAGIVSAEAARALARIPHPMGSEILKDIILSEDDKPLLEEVAVYGLGGTLSLDAYEGIGQALHSANTDISSRAVQAAYETLSAPEGHISTKRAELLAHLAQLVLTSPEDTPPPLNLAVRLARELLRLYPSRDAGLLLLETIQGGQTTREICLAIDLAEELAVPSREQALAETLLTRDHHPVVYETIAEKYSPSQEGALLEVAQFIKREKGFERIVFSLISPRKADSLRARLDAALKILDFPTQNS